MIAGSFKGVGASFARIGIQQIIVGRIRLSVSVLRTQVRPLHPWFQIWLKYWVDLRTSLHMVSLDFI